MSTNASSSIRVPPAGDAGKYFHHRRDISLYRLIRTGRKILRAELFRLENGHRGVDAEFPGLIGCGGDYAALRTRPTMTGFPRCSGLSACSTDAKKASMSRCRILLVTDLDSYLTSNTGQWDRTPTLKLMVPQPSDTFSHVQPV